MDRQPHRIPGHCSRVPACLVLLSAAFPAIMFGCAAAERHGARPTTFAPPPTTLPAETAATGDEFAQRLQADPVAGLREVRTLCNALSQYRLTFYRQERLGGKLRPREQIRTLFRKDPFSVKFIWDDPKADYYESTYVAGQNDGKLVVRERKSALPLLPPTTRRVNPEDAVSFGRALHPVTEFGLAKLVRRTLTPLEDPAARPHITIAYRGVTDLQPQNARVYHVRIERPPTPGVSYIAQDFYIDVQTHLPAGTDLYQPEGQLAGSYRYADVDTNANLTDADFQLGGG